MNDFFDDDAVRFDLLKERAFNLRWATVEDGVIPLTAADPDFPVAPVIREAIADYTAGGVFSYGPPEGLPSFREAAAKVLRERHAIAGCSADCVLPTDSAASGMFVVARHALEPGDEALIFDPVDFLFGACVDNAGGVAVRSRMDVANRAFDLDGLAALVTERTKVLAICNPHNPLGRVMTEDELRAVGELACERDLLILSDEIWCDIVHAPHRHVAIASLSPDFAERTVGVYGFSKTFGLAGLRVGFLAAPNPEVRDRLLDVSRAPTTAYGVATLSQVAAQAAYEHAWPWAEAFLDHLLRMRDLVVARLNAIEGVTTVAPEGTYVVFANVEGLGLGDQDDVAAWLHEHARVRVVPGSPRWFGPGAAGHVRLTFCTSEAVLTEALDRIEDALTRRG